MHRGVLVLFWKVFFCFVDAHFPCCLFLIAVFKMFMDTKFIVSNVLLNKIRSRTCVMHEIKWALTWRWWFVEREKIAMFMGNGLDSQFVIQAKVGER